MSLDSIIIGVLFYFAMQVKCFRKNAKSNQVSSFYVNFPFDYPLFRSIRKSFHVIRLQTRQVVNSFAPLHKMEENFVSKTIANKQ